MIPVVYAALVEPPLVCARVVAHDRNSYIILTESGESRAQIRGALRYENDETCNLPVVGDYVAASGILGSMSIEAVLPRKNLFARRAVDGSYSMQAIAANLDTLFITVAVNRDFNLRRIERYAVAAAALCVPYAVLLSKLDLVDHVDEFLSSTRSVVGEVPVLALSAFEGHGLQLLDPFRGAGKTIAFVGSSGVGKSTLINTLLGSSALEVKESRADDDRGRHTSTRRLLLHLDDGTAIIDTPGMREFALADAEAGLSTAFGDLSDMAAFCRFRDCRHSSEPGCAVKDSLDQSRLANWRKLEREAAFEARKQDPLAQAAERARWKAIHKANRKRLR